MSSFDSRLASENGKHLFKIEPNTFVLYDLRIYHDHSFSPYGMRSTWGCWVGINQVEVDGVQRLVDPDKQAGICIAVLSAKTEREAEQSALMAACESIEMWANEGSLYRG